MHADSEPTAETDEGWLTTKRRLIIAIVVLVVVAVALMVINQIVKTKKTENVAIVDAVTSVEVDLASANVTLNDSGSLSVSRSVEYVFRKPGYSAKVEDGVLLLKAGCDGFRIGACSASYVVGVPSNIPVMVKAGSGSVGVKGLKADVQVSGKGSSVDVDGSYGKVDVETTSGSFSGTALSSREVVVKTTSGAISMKFAAAPTKASGVSTSGDVRITVPKSSTSYAVDASSQSGKTTTSVARDTNSPFSLKAQSSSGDVTVEASR